MEENQPDPHFTELMAHIAQHMKPAPTPEKAGLKLSTMEVYDKLQAFYPSDRYGPQEVFLALKELGYVHADPFKTLDFVWLFK